MTRKLYYEDSHLYRFQANVVSCEENEKGYAVILDATAFYPEGGGQACDLGTLNGVSVLDVQEQGKDVVHYCANPVTGSVEGIIDQNRRFDLMQQHTGEHIVSGIVCQRFGYHNVGFHVGADLITIDFDGPIPADALPEIELEANRAVWQNLPVRCWVPSPEELPSVTYRTKRALPWPVRIVEVPGTDSCACCGVHVKHTGEIGLIKLFSCVKFHQGVRIEMACGGRALEILNQAYDQNRQVSQAFSAKIMETGEGARRMNERLTAAEFRATGLERRIFELIAEGYAGKGDVQHYEAGLAPAAVRELSDRIARSCGGTAAVFSDNGAMCLVNKNGDVKPLGDALCQKFGGRGGGKYGYFQGSLKAEWPEIKSFFVI
ncbi:MAG: alanyl-tRNA editing protein [Oscillospiraceae bacterium]|nr:alanyl-tRNA editing protein [Oscillospiraceae bacterium]